MNGFRFNKTKTIDITLPGPDVKVETSSTSGLERSSPDPDETWDDVDLSSTEYARRGKELMRLINDLRSMGAETMIDLPSIVVIGGQSAGKSSLVEAVSGVNVPRDSGTCTRCPMECTMSSSAKTWSCSIKLRFDYDSSGRDLARSKEVAFGAPITDRNDVDIWLRRAQAAILNPHTPPENFHKKTVTELRTINSTSSLKFSRNVVVISIEDPGAINLSFVDLPGLIQNEEQEVIDLVQDITVKAISRSNTIILTTIPMSDDMQNQQSVRLAREADPEGERTIGVLTKPDTLGEGAVNAKKLWLDVIEGHQYALKNGYYCVRLPDDAQRTQRLSRAAVQKLEGEYFDTSLPWSQAKERGRFGIPPFISQMSVLLVEHIEKSLPKLRQDVEQLLASCLEDLYALPAPLTGDPQVEVLGKVNEFCAAFKSVVDGTSSDKTLAQRNRALYAVFKRDIRGTAPDFRPFERPEIYRTFDALEPDETLWERDPGVQTMGVLDVQNTIKESIGWELPKNIPYEAKIRLISQFTTLWTAPAERCLTAINKVLDDVIKGLIEAHFGRFKVLQELVSVLIQPDIEEYKNRARSAMKETLELELRPNYTQNTHYLQSLCEKWLSRYKVGRRNSTQHLVPAPVSPMPTFDDSDQPSVKKKKNSQAISACSIPAAKVYRDSSAETEALHYLSQAGYSGLSVADLARLLPPDAFEDELIVMADVRAYFHVAYKRIIDHIPLKIEHSLHQALAGKLSVTLLQSLIVDTTARGDFAERMKELASEDPTIALKRDHLQARRARLHECRRKLANFSA
ncbi:hypothetical protein PAXRUDRAFT_830752 [Paxillus rubicundulus Ve08.2h10]|uniref:Unplaced genomic scaffold scaffold_553, whole genome shotgun sequence n=1 Tax=Paxillus rubicundulus Ve08.2h10 TaxID=930991 RepID=A0A0D0DT19_9AGAM|nr:hypothetical protein PAXRUDRAFT_830752 [Paxillus rubicundulus Ve08.2h10]